MAHPGVGKGNTSGANRLRAEQLLLDRLPHKQKLALTEGPQIVHTIDQDLRHKAFADIAAIVLNICEFCGCRIEDVAEYVPAEPRPDL
jgi:hypothetical protein